ncbi:cation/calcium exchanger 4-like [Typha latifolia]|uniref:cation/calcium exchanger 4-like n=1 Tax=Typha latifolia TaxID=4733 RepID=UPI003C30450D
MTKPKHGYRAAFAASCALVLLLFFYNRGDVVRNPFLNQRSNFGPPWKIYESNINPRQRIAELSLPNSANISENFEFVVNPNAVCSGITQHEGFANACEFLRSHRECSYGGLFDYFMFFHCTCENFHVLGYAVLVLWLLALFYLLGNTAADYFCCSLSKLANLLRLPPTVAGVTLLPLGNGAPDVFASIAAFMGSGSGEVGLNSVLGGALFVTCVVVGIVSLCVAKKNVQIDRKCFIRDVTFFLFTLVVLSIILIIGKVDIIGAATFVMIYLVYAFVVAAHELLGKHAHMLKLDAVHPLIPVAGSIFSNGGDEDTSIYNPFLDDVAIGDVPQFTSLPQWMWASHVAIFSNYGHRSGTFDKSKPLWGWGDEAEDDKSLLLKVLAFAEMPLTFPRRCTIPVVEEDRWSKAFAVTSASLAPFLLAFLWDTHDKEDSRVNINAYTAAGIVGVFLGALALLFTTNENPPRRYLLPWVLGGFFMSIIWFYIVANELLALLVALGTILHINPSILGLTVLAWGNSMGDLTSNVALALKGSDEVQVAISGCYAGPMFNTLVGLGISVLIAAWSARPASYVLPKNSSLIYTMGFLICGLLWVLFALPRSEMRPSKMLGISLIALYLIFLSIRVSAAAGNRPMFGLH